MPVSAVCVLTVLRVSISIRLIELLIEPTPAQSNLGSLHIHAQL